jgi:hypothetical protein
LHGNGEWKIDSDAIDFACSSDSAVEHFDVLYRSIARRYHYPLFGLEVERVDYWLLKSKRTVLVSSFLFLSEFYDGSLQFVSLHSDRISYFDGIALLFKSLYHSATHLKAFEGL